MRSIRPVHTLVPWALALAAPGCTMEAARGDLWGAAEGSAPPVTGGPGGDLTDRRIRNEATSLCLQRRASLDVVTSSTCSSVNEFLRWDITNEGGDLWSIRLSPDPSLCVTLLTFEPSDVPVIGPCSEADLESAGQLFHLESVGASNYLISDPLDQVYVTALQPSGVVMMELGDDSLPSTVLQRWKFH